MRMIFLLLSVSIVQASTGQHITHKNTSETKVPSRTLTRKKFRELVKKTFRRYSFKNSKKCPVGYHKVDQKGLIDLQCSKTEKFTKEQTHYFRRFYAVGELQGFHESFSDQQLRLGIAFQSEDFDGESMDENPSIFLLALGKISITLQFNPYGQVLEYSIDRQAEFKGKYGTGKVRKYYQSKANLFLDYIKLLLTDLCKLTSHEKTCKANKDIKEVPLIILD